MIKQICLAIGIIFLCIRGIQQTLFSESDHPIDSVLFAIDLSHSMNTQDINIYDPQTQRTEQISRLDWTKQVITQALQKQNDANPIPIGVIIFAQTPLFHIPPTQDYAYIQNKIDTLHTNQLPQQGSNIHNTLQYIQELEGNNHYYLISDGGEQKNKTRTGGSIKNTTIIGVGSRSGGPIRYPNGEVFIDSQEQTHNSILQEENLQTLAKSIHATYHSHDHYDQHAIALPQHTSSTESIRKYMLLVAYGLIMLGL